MSETELTPLLLTVEEAATVLRTSRSDMYRLIQRGDVETVPIGRGQRVVYESLVAYVNRLREAS
jgi:excisionase family DNA binding protein